MLKDGARVTTRPAAELEPPTLVRLMVGRALSAYYPPRATELGDVRLEVRGGTAPAISGIDLTVRAGEVVGVAGLQGSGRTELLRAIFGADPFTAGEVLLDGEPVRLTSPRRAIRAGIAMVTEDRKAEGLALEQSVRDNALLVLRAVFRRRARAGAVRTRDLLATVGLRSAGEDQEVRFLSGGNQQKVVLAKWLAADPRVLLLDEPTRGIDVGAKAAIHELIRELAKAGMAVLMVSLGAARADRAERPDLRAARGQARRRAARRCIGGGRDGAGHRSRRTAGGGPAVTALASGSDGCRGSRQAPPRARGSRSAWWCCSRPRS